MQRCLYFQRSEMLMSLQQLMSLADVLSHNRAAQHNPCSPSKFPITLGSSTTATLITHAVRVFSSVPLLFLSPRFLPVLTFLPPPPVLRRNKHPTCSYSRGYGILRLYVLLFDWILAFPHSWEAWGGKTSGIAKCA